MHILTLKYQSIALSISFLSSCRSGSGQADPSPSSANISAIVSVFSTLNDSDNVHLGVPCSTVTCLVRQTRNYVHSTDRTLS